MWSQRTRQLVHAACHEDLGGRGDITSALLPDAGDSVDARLVVRETGVLCGVALAPFICEVFAGRLGQLLAFEPLEYEGKRWLDGLDVAAGSAVGVLRGPRAAVLATERTLLNFMARMSGVASLTRRYVNAARGANPHVNILDTRKTLPGWRELDKYAVAAGGGFNHRFGLYDAILIKDNHLAGVPAAKLGDHLTALLKRRTGEAAFVEVEVDNRGQFAAICQVPGIDIVLLDNFTLDDLRTAVAERNRLGLVGRVALEASGGITLANVADVAATGVDRISIGALTHSAPALDLSLDF